MGSGVNFTTYINNTADLVVSVNNAFSRLMPNIGGPQANKRKLNEHVVQSVMLYAGPVWEETLNKQITGKDWLFTFHMR